MGCERVIHFEGCLGVGRSGAADAVEERHGESEAIELEAGLDK